MKLSNKNSTTANTINNNTNIILAENNTEEILRNLKKNSSTELFSKGFSVNSTPATEELLA